MWLTDKKPIKKVFNSDKDWLSERQGIGSSEIATIVGLNPWESPYHLWLKKTGQIPPTEDNFAMKAGRYLEDAVGRFFEDATGRQIIKSSAGKIIFIHPEKQFLKVSPDRMFWLEGLRNDENKGVLECKTTQATVDGNDIPQYWFCQLQYQLGVMQRENGALAWLSGGRDFGFHYMNFVPDFYAWMVEEAEKFWVDNILGNKAPEIRTASDVMAMYSRHTEQKIIEVSGELAETCSKLKEVKLKIKDLEAEQALMEDEIKLAFTDAEAITFNGATLATWKNSKDGERFDAKALQAEKPEIYRQYLKIQPGTRRFLLK